MNEEHTEEIDKQDSESYKHNYAKATVCKWLRATATKNRGHLYEVFYDTSKNREFISLYSCTNRRDRLAGIFDEYPLTMEHGPKSWDEIEEFGYDIPKYESLIKKSFNPIAVLDIGIIHCGEIRYGIEVVHKHGITKRKLTKIQNFRKAWELP
jgi:hypothetical protein